MMANSHLDRDQSQWLDELKARAERIKSNGQSKITGGAEGEQVLQEWGFGGVCVRQLPADEHGVLRISIGGGATPVPLNYCVFRGDHGACVDLLRKALAALEAGPNE
jgi:hypothetical protein